LAANGSERRLAYSELLCATRKSDLLNCIFMIEDRVPVSIRVLGIRQKLGWTQQQLADQLGVTQATVNRWEKAKKMPSPLAATLIEQLEQAISEGGAGLPASSWGIRRQLPTPLNVHLTIQLPVGASAAEIDALVASLAKHLPNMASR
jgi:transcriptional regulator with XRE-family HTH domain